MNGRLQLDSTLRQTLDQMARDTGESEDAIVSRLVIEALSTGRNGVGEWSRFTARLAHELRTPLSSLLMMVELLADTRPTGLGEDAVRYVQNIQRAAYDVLRIVEDVHALARIEGGREPLRPGPVQLAELLSEVERETAAEAESNDVSLSIAAGPTPVVVTTDREHLRDILRALVGNALRVRSSDAVTVEVDALDDGTVTVSVSDTGPPLSAEQLDAIFVPFHRADSRGSRKYGGSGLELVVAEARARALGGSLHALAVDGRTRLSLRLPPDLPAEPRSPGDREAP